MGNAGSAPDVRRARPASPTHDALPNKAPKVLPDLDENPRLRSTDNGAILLSGGTISGRKPQRATQEHPGVYRTRSASSGEAAEDSARGAGGGGRREPVLRRERDPLHRSHNHLDQALATPGGFGLQAKGFGSEPDLRDEAEKPKVRTNKHFRKKYKAPAPPSNHMGDRDGSSPDSYEGHPRAPPVRKLRLFKTRSETKKFCYGSELTSKFSYNDTLDIKIPKEEKYESGYTDRRFRSPSRDHYLQYPAKGRDMVQSPSSLRREENIFQASLVKEELKKNKMDKYNAYKLKGQKNAARHEIERTPHLDRNFRHSERFRKESNEHCALRREKSFDASLNMKDQSEQNSWNSYSDRKRYLSEQYKRPSNDKPILFTDKSQKKSLPSLLHIIGNEKKEFQEELKEATSRIRNEHTRTSSMDGSQKSGLGKTSQINSIKNNFKDEQSKIPVSKNTMLQLKSKDRSSRGNETNNQQELEERNSKKKEFELQQACAQAPLRADDGYNKMDSKTTTKQVSSDVSENISSRRGSRGLTDRGQASGKESTPEQSPNRLNDVDKLWDREPHLPSKQFYFGMIDTTDAKMPEVAKEFPGLGAPINGDFNSYHLIEKKLLNYRDEETDIDKFANKVQNTALNGRTISSESALSSEPEVGENSEEDNPYGIALLLRPTLPKKQLEIPRFSPAAAWRQLAAMEASRDLSPLAPTASLLASVAVPTTIVGSAQHDRSGDSGISGDAPHDVPRIDSPNLPRKHALPAQWTPEQDLEGDSSSDAGPEPRRPPAAVRIAANASAPAAARFHARNQLFSLSLPRETHLAHSAEKNKQFQQPFNSLQKLKKSVTGALGAALGARKYEAGFDDDEGEVNQNWFLSKSAPNSLTHGLLHQQLNVRKKTDKDEHIGEGTTPPAFDQEEGDVAAATVPRILGKQPAFSYLSSGGHVMYLPQYDADAAVARDQPRSLLAPTTSYTTKEGLRPWRDERLLRTKSSGEIELRLRRSKTSEKLEEEMRERRPSASPPPQQSRHTTKSSETTVTTGISSGIGASRRFAFQSPARQLERRRLAERLAREAELRECRRRGELEAMRRVEEEFQRKRAREKASIRQQLRLVGGHSSLPPLAALHQLRDEPDGAVSSSESPPPASPRAPASPHTPAANNNSRGSPRPASAASGRDKSRATSSSERTTKSTSTTAPATRVLSEWRVSHGARQYRDWSAGPAPRVHPSHPPACYRMPKGPHAVYATNNGHAAAGAGGVDIVDGYVGGCAGSPRSDDYRRDFARGSAASSSGSELSARRTTSREDTREKSDVGVRRTDPARTEAAIIPTVLKAPPPLLKIR